MPLFDASPAVSIMPPTAFAACVGCIGKEPDSALDEDRPRLDSDWPLHFRRLRNARTRRINYSEKLLIKASAAANWSNGPANILQLEGPVTIVSDGVKCSAKRAVIWLSPMPGGLLQEQQVDIVLIGDATLHATDNHLTRTAPELLVNLVVRGTIQLSATARVAQDLSQSPTFAEAKSIRAASQGPDQSAPGHGLDAPLTTTALPPPPAVGGTSVSGVVQPTPSKTGSIRFHASLIEPTVTGDGTKALQLGGGVTSRRLPTTAISWSFLPPMSFSSAAIAKGIPPLSRLPANLLPAKWAIISRLLIWKETCG